MPFSHHSHSGQFCAHAKNTLAEMIDTARKRHMQLFALTEHMPRGDDDLYPEEREIGLNAVTLATRFTAYFEEAQRLREYNNNANAHGNGNGSTKMQILIGAEVEWIRPNESSRLVQELTHRYSLDYIIGSVHHVRTVPIDFNKELYAEVRQICGGTDEELFSEYFDSQYAMLQLLKPKIVGHLDLIRLLSDQPDLDWAECDKGRIWCKIKRNLEFIAAYGGLLEINTSAWRKGLKEPYPTGTICRAFLALGGKFVMSDDSHAVEQIGTNYERLVRFCQEFGLTEMSYLYQQDGCILTRSITLEDVESLQFWNGL